MHSQTIHSPDQIILHNTKFHDFEWNFDSLRTRGPRVTVKYIYFSKGSAGCIAQLVLVVCKSTLGNRFNFRLWLRHLDSQWIVVSIIL